MQSTKPPVVAELVDLVGVMRRADGFAEVREALLRGEGRASDGAWGSSCALAAAALVADQRDVEALRSGTSTVGRNRRAKGAAAANISPSPLVGEGRGGGASALGPSTPTLTLPHQGGGNCPSAPTRVGDPVLMVVLPRISEVDDFAVDIAGFLGRPPEILPAWEVLPREQKATDPVLTGRMRVLRDLDRPDTIPRLDTPPKNAGPPLSRLVAKRRSQADAPPAADDDSPLRRAGSGGPSRTIVASFPALLQPVPSRAQIAESTRTLRVGQTAQPEEFIGWLVGQGFDR